MPDQGRPGGEGVREAPVVWRLRIYVAGDAPRGRVAIENLRRLCAEHLPGRFAIEVIDIQADPAAALRENIVAIPTVRRDHPLPARTLVGTLSDTARSMKQLDLATRKALQ